jgi:isocitrate dehydrogenase (NAD+)
VQLYSLYANIRPARSSAGVRTPFDGIDIVVYRENTEDLYTGEEKWTDADTVEGIKRITRSASERIARSAFEYALAHGRKRVTAVHKANVCIAADGLFLSTARAVAAQFPTIAFDDTLADSALTKLVQPLSARAFDVLLCPNLYGDLISDLTAGLVGSLGLCPSMQIGHPSSGAVFEPCHGSAPDIAGKGIANPISQIR